MIWDSYVWKEELARDLRALKRQIQKAPASGKESSKERLLVAIEKFAFNSAFIIRKLAEANKLSDEIEGRYLPVRSFDRINRSDSIDSLNWHKLERFYALDTPHEAKLSPRELCNQLIHSFVFVVVWADGVLGPNALLFNSDHTKNKGVFEISLEELFSFIEGIVEDDIVSFSFDRSTDRLRKLNRLAIP